MNKHKWLMWFVGAVSLFGIWEYIAITDGNEDTYTLTTAVITYVPQWVFWSLLIPFLAWFLHHFYTYYRDYYKKRNI